MAAIKGNAAKANVVKKIAKLFGDDWIGENGGKYYVWADDGGEKVQIYISLTHPKVYIESANAVTPSVSSSEKWDFETDVIPQFTPEERKNINKLMEKFNL